ncbi:MAG: hypothetical protein IPH31_10155 [Lewinellaceae bacterium]|nr:hypothetical protein [Lewinellaceae bacterium]
MQTPGRADLLPMLANLTEASFEATAEAVFAYQSVHNSVYSKYLGLLGHSKVIQTSNAPSSPFPFLKPTGFKRAFGRPKLSSIAAELLAKRHPVIWCANSIFT